MTTARSPRGTVPARCRLASLAAASALAAASTPSLALNGTFMPAFGPRSLGVGGVGVAMPQDRMVMAVNPAGLALVEPGLDANLMLFEPHREGSVDCRGLGFCDTTVRSESSRGRFLVPGFGYSHRFGDRTTLGIAFYANGGMNTSYDRALYDEAAFRIMGARPGTPGFPVRGKIGVDASQAVVSPTLAYRLTPSLALGISPLLSVQRFSARGLQSFGPLSTDPTSLSGRGNEYVLGGGVRVGAVYDVQPGLRFGFQFTSPLYMQRYTKYNGLFAGNGSMDSPAHFTVGIGWTPMPTLTVGFDFQRVFFGDIGALANATPAAAELTGAIARSRMLGGSEGFGFGWTNETIYKLGAIYRPTERLSLRVGWNHTPSVVPARSGLFAPIMPTIMEDHLGAGFSWRLAGGDEITFGYLHALGNTLKARRTAFFGAEVDTWASTDSFDFGYSWKF